MIPLLCSERRKPCRERWSNGNPTAVLNRRCCPPEARLTKFTLRDSEPTPSATTPTLSSGASQFAMFLLSYARQEEAIFIWRSDHRTEHLTINLLLTRFWASARPYLRVPGSFKLYGTCKFYSGGSGGHRDNAGRRRNVAHLEQEPHGHRSRIAISRA
jgi:hypothetical protein